MDNEEKIRQAEMVDALLDDLNVPKKVGLADLSLYGRVVAAVQLAKYGKIADLGDHSNSWIEGLLK